jgi:hypothetical protein
MSERKDKTPEQVSDEDYKIAPTSADKEIVNKAATIEKKGEQATTGENYQLPEDKVQEELREGVE